LDPTVQAVTGQLNKITNGQNELATCKEELKKDIRAGHEELKTDVTVCQS
jgi:hypothetical protein